MLSRGIDRRYRRLQAAALFIMAWTAQLTDGFTDAFVKVSPTSIFTSSSSSSSSFPRHFPRSFSVTIAAEEGDSSMINVDLPPERTKDDDQSISTIATTLHGRLLCASQCAYSEKTKLRDNPYFRGAGYLPGTSIRIITLRSGKDGCLVGNTVDGIVVAFRGTSGSALEWLQNLSIYLRRVPKSFAPREARVHEGFYGAIHGSFGRAILAAIMECLDQPKHHEHHPNQPTRIYVTGHSKGGSLASLFAVMLHNENKLPSPELVCTFGAARVGNAAFGKYYESIVRQVTYENDKDLVPFLPPGEETVQDMESVTEDPDGMMEMIEDIFDPDDVDVTKGLLFSLGRRLNQRKRGVSQWKYQPIGKRTYIDLDGGLLAATRELDSQRIRDLEGTSFQDLRRAHCSSCSDKDDRGKELSTFKCNGGYFAALAPEICELVSASVSI